MRNYAVLEGMKRQSKDVIECAFNKGYEQGYQDGKGEREKEYKEALHNIENTYIKGHKAEYDRGYKEGKEAAEDDMCKYYNKHFNDVVNSSNDDAYQRGYEDGRNEILTIKVFEEYYQKGLKNGQELRAKEAECAEACGMKRAWELAYKLIFNQGNIRDSFDYDTDKLGKIEVLENIFNTYSASEAVEKVEVWEKKQEQIKKNCDNCKHNNVASGIDGTCYECIKGIHDNYEEKTEKSCENCGHHRGGDVGCEAGGCSLIRENWIPQKKQDAPEINVESIKVGDECICYCPNEQKVVVTAVLERKNQEPWVTIMRKDGACYSRSSRGVTKTGNHYDIQSILDKMKENEVKE